MKKTYPYIDFLKVLGLSCIFLAHVNPPAVVMQIRNFDVPLMVIVSGFLASITSVESIDLGTGICITYYKKRLERLVIPTWIFLLFYFFSCWLITGWLDFKIVIKSFLFQQDSIGYVWIIFVYVITAFLTPILLKLYNNYGKRFVLGYAFLYIVYEVLVFFKVGVNSRLFIYTLYYAIPYGLILLLGLLYKKLSNKKQLAVVILSLIIFGSIAFAAYIRTGSFVPTQGFKYPPTIYWISYAVGVSYLLMMVCEHFENSHLFNNFVIRFIGRNTLWIYLWHIPFVLLSAKITSFWILRFLIVVIGAVAVDFIQRLVVIEIDKKCGLRASCVTRFFVG